MLSLSQVLLSFPMERSGQALIDLAAGAQVDFAASRRFCLHYVLEGELAIAFNGEVKPLRAGDFTCVLRGGAHRIFTPSPAVSFRSKLLSALEPADEPRRVRFGPARAPLGGRMLSASLMLRGSGGATPESLTPDMAVLSAGDGGLSSLPPPQMVLEACSGSGAGAFAAGLMRVLFIQYLRDQVTRRLSREQAEFWDGPANKVGRGQVLIERYFQDPWSVTKLAQTAGMSRSSFAQKFEASTGEGPIAALRAIRLGEARRLLEGRAGITEIAQAVGYRSLSAFSRAFQRRHGETPSAFRKRRLGENGGAA